MINGIIVVIRYKSYSYVNILWGVFIFSSSFIHIFSRVVLCLWKNLLFNDAMEDRCLRFYWLRIAQKTVLNIFIGRKILSDKIYFSLCIHIYVFSKHLKAPSDSQRPWNTHLPLRLEILFERVETGSRSTSIVSRSSTK